MTKVTTLPLDLILAILNLAVDGALWRLPSFLLLSKSIRAGLLHRAFQQIHVYSERRLDELIEEDFQSTGTGQDGKTGAAILWSKESNSKRSLYLHFIETLTDDSILQSELIARLEMLSEGGAKDLHTLGMRLTGDSTYLPKEASGLWACDLFKGLKRLYIDLSHLPSFNQTHRGLYMGDESEDEVRVRCRSTELECFAISQSHVKPELPCRWPFDYGETAFPKLQRLYIFTFCDALRSDDAMDEDLARIAADRIENTPVKFIINVMVKLTMIASSTPRCAGFALLSSGCRVVGPIVVAYQPGSQQDALSTMHKVIEDVDASLGVGDTDSFAWSPATRPCYIVAPPQL